MSVVNVSLYLDYISLSIVQSNLMGFAFIAGFSCSDFFLTASRFESTCNGLIIWLWIDFLAVVPAFSDHLYDRWVSARFKLFFLPWGPNVPAVILL